jgi:hypothetical protein
MSSIQVCGGSTSSVSNYGWQTHKHTHLQINGSRKTWGWATLSNTAAYATNSDVLVTPLRNDH